MAMDTATWIAICMPIFVLLIIVLPQRHMIMAAKKNRRKRGNAIMANEIVKKFLGKTCTIYTTGTFGCVKGQISTVEDNWIEVITKKGSQLVNAEFVTVITETGK
jgi:hypothetical protein